VILPMKLWGEHASVLSALRAVVTVSLLGLGLALLQFNAIKSWTIRGGRQSTPRRS